MLSPEVQNPIRVVLGPTVSELRAIVQKPTPADSKMNFTSYPTLGRYICLQTIRPRTKLPPSRSMSTGLDCKSVSLYEFPHFMDVHSKSGSYNKPPNVLDKPHVLNTHNVLGTPPDVLYKPYNVLDEPVCYPAPNELDRPSNVLDRPPNGLDRPSNVCYSDHVLIRPSNVLEH